MINSNKNIDLSLPIASDLTSDDNISSIFKSQKSNRHVHFKTDVNFNFDTDNITSNNEKKDKHNLNNIENDNTIKFKNKPQKQLEQQQLSKIANANDNKINENINNNNESNLNNNNYDIDENNEENDDEIQKINEYDIETERQPFQRSTKKMKIFVRKENFQSDKEFKIPKLQKSSREFSKVEDYFRFNTNKLKSNPIFSLNIKEEATLKQRLINNLTNTTKMVILPKLYIMSESNIKCSEILTFNTKLTTKKIDFQIKNFYDEGSCYFIRSILYTKFR